MNRYTLVFLGVLLLALPLSAQVAIIANKSAKIENLDQKKLADIYSLSLIKCDDGQKIVVFDMKTDSPSKDKFYTFIDKSSADLRKHWMRLQLTGEGKAPKALPSEDEMLKMVATTANAIGFVSAAKVDDSVVVLLTIN
ncbi:MAG: hypothetical protein KDE57_13670 [Calditrichaeota bacterium]|nr:hypothetical protein [Calditrichota bacterium]